MQSTANPFNVHNEFYAVSCTTASVCTAVGDGSNWDGPQVTLAERWNGAGWQVQATPNPAGEAYATLDGVSCTSATACTAVGYYQDSVGKVAAFAERWNGTSWQVQATPTPAGSTTSVLSGVSCTTASACTAVGGYTNSAGTRVALAERWNGGSWRVQATRALPAKSSGFSGVSCPAASACTAVGAYTTVGGRAVTLAERWNGTSWQLQATPNPGGATATTLSAVSCKTATACTAVGDYTNSAGAQSTLAERWNGTSWQVQATPMLAGTISTFLDGVSCAAASVCTAVGGQSPDGLHVGEVAEQWNGTSWQVQLNPGAPALGFSVLSGVSCVTASACSAVGSAGHTLIGTLAWGYS
jgi:hypothetical protein